MQYKQISKNTIKTIPRPLLEEKSIQHPIAPIVHKQAVRFEARDFREKDYQAIPRPCSINPPSSKHIHDKIAPNSRSFVYFQLPP
jgi:hypothetical protein